LFYDSGRAIRGDGADRFYELINIYDVVEYNQEVRQMRASYHPHNDAATDAL
jgi:hypothetical protein